MNAPAGLCETRPWEWWDTGDPGNRLALALCRVCPARDGEDCLAGEPDPHPRGVIRAGVAFNERGRRCDICACGYPVDDVASPTKIPPGCRHCRVPRLQSWARRYLSRNEYFAQYYRRRKKQLEGTSASGTVGVLAGDPADVLPGVSGNRDQVALPSTFDEGGVADGVGQLPAPLVQRRLSAPVGADGGRHGVVGHELSVTEPDVATQGWPSINTAP